MVRVREMTPAAVSALLPDVDDPRVVVSGNGGVPWALLRAVDAALPAYRLHMLNAPTGVPDRPGVTYETTFVGAGMRRHPALSYVPSRLSRVPRLYQRRLVPNIVLVHTSMPVGGKVSLGIEVNVMPGAIEAARAHGGVVIAQANPNMPYTYGDGEYDVDSFDAVFQVDELLASHGAAPASDDSERARSARTIGGLVADRIDSGATLQLGIGEIPDATLAGLLDKRDLGVWTEMVPTGVLALDEVGALDADREIVGSFALGTTELYRWLDRNDQVRILRTEVTNAPSRIAQNPGMTSINTALQVDLLDQANASRIGGRIHSGFGGQTDFTVGATHAPGGQAIMALRSWHPKADTSTIVARLSEPVTSFQHTAVVTEQGVAEIEGRDERAQATNIIEHAAHPSVREHLWAEAREMGLA